METPHAPVAAAPPAGHAGLRFDRGEWAGAFGDLGTLVPFLLAYITVVGVEPAGMLLAFGIAFVAAGAYFRTPFPVQPMKAIGAIAVTGAAQTAVITPQAVAVAALATGLIWLAIGASGTADRIARWVGRPVVLGITLGLGLAFMLEGTRMMAAGIWLAVPLLLVTILLLSNRALVAMVLILATGVAWAVLTDPAVTGALTRVEISLKYPAWPFQGLTWEAFFVGVVLLALPQIPLTLGNAVIAPVEFNNREFADRPVTERKVAVSTGVMNTLGSLIGGVPMCHGAGGMAAQFSFGARTGGAPVIIGGLLIVLALGFSDSVAILLRLFPHPALGVMLFLAGVQLALGSCDFSRDKGERFVTLGTAALSVWNVGVAFVFGLTVLWIVRKGWLRL
ncbi:MAG: sulfate transporter [Betaproteobacteria bacterium RIFCSPLOWO2_02_FULL_67_26]|nr:MAG: sulfate transporter [Betaproteobacteria bacterium RIFCSPLOWO2_02_FULL_67_26]